MDEFCAIMRVEKQKTEGEIAAMAGHWQRTRPTPNADPARRKFNKCIHGAADPFVAFKKLMQEKGITKFRKNGVLMLEFVLTFSPEYIRDPVSAKYRLDMKDRIAKWAKLSKKWVLDRFGDNCISMMYHADETTPHFHVAVCPLELKTRKSGKQEWTLNARNITGGADKLSKLQDSYADAVSSTGLKRGMRRSTAKHTTIKQFYAAIQESKVECEKLNIRAPDATPKSFNAWRNTMNNVIAALKKAKEDDSEKLHKIIDELVATNERLKQQLENSYNHSQRPFRH